MKNSIRKYLKLMERNVQGRDNSSLLGYFSVEFDSTLYILSRIPQLDGMLVMIGCTPFHLSMNTIAISVKNAHKRDEVLFEANVPFHLTGCVDVDVRRFRDIVDAFIIDFLGVEMTSQYVHQGRYEKMEVKI